MLYKPLDRSLDEKILFNSLTIMSCGQKSHSELKLTDATVIRNSSHPAVMQVPFQILTVCFCYFRSLIITSNIISKAMSVSIVVQGTNHYMVLNSFLFTYKDILKDREFTRLNRTLKDLAVVYYSGKPFKDFLTVDSESTLEHGTESIL